MADDRNSLGQVLHEARIAGGEARPRPWPPEAWADRDPRLRELDEAMAAAVVAAAFGDHLPAVLRALNVAISEARHAQQQDELGKLEAALEALGGSEEGSVIVRSDEKEAGRG